MKKQKEVEREIHEIEDRLKELTAALGDEENYRNGSARELTQEYNERSARLHNLYSEWEEICEKTDEVQRQLEDYAST